MREAKIKHMALPVEEAPRQRAGNVIDLMDALRKSIGADTFRQEATEERKGSASSQRHRTGQRAGQVRNNAAAPFVWTGFSGFEWKDCSVVVVAVGM